MEPLSEKWVCLRELIAPLILKLDVVLYHQDLHLMGVLCTENRTTLGEALSAIISVDYSTYEIAQEKFLGQEMQSLNVIFDDKKLRQKQFYKKTENAEKLIEALAAGYSHEDIANYLNVRPGTVNKFFEIAEETLGIPDALAPGYGYKTIADYLRVRRETVDKPVEIAEEIIGITKEDLPDENMIAKYFGHVKPNIPNVQFLNDDHIMKIRACLHAGCPATSIDKYLNKTPGTINRWKNEGRFDDSVIREAERRSRRKNNDPDNFAAKLEELKRQQEERQRQAPADEIGRLKNEIQQCEQRARNYEMQLEQEKGEISRLKARLDDIRRMTNL